MNGREPPLACRVERLVGLSRAKGLSNPDSVVMGYMERMELRFIIENTQTFPNPEGGPESFMGLVVINVHQHSCLMVGTITKE